MIPAALRIFGMIELGLLTAGSIMSAVDAPPLSVPARRRAAEPGVAEGVAAEFLARVDWSSPTLLIWMPGVNSSPGIRNEFIAALKGVRRRHWSGALEYPRHADIPRNLPIGIRALELVLAEIKRRDPSGTRYRVVVGADSFGALITNETLRGPLAGVIDRVATFGMPAVASRLPADRAAKVRAHRNGLDPSTMPYVGLAELWMNSGDLMFGGGSSRVPGALLHAMLNPFGTLVAGVTTAWFLLRGGDKGPGFREHPHNYYEQMPVAARWLVDGA